VQEIKEEQYISNSNAICVYKYFWLNVCVKEGKLWVGKDSVDLVGQADMMMNIKTTFRSVSHDKINTQEHQRRLEI